MAQATTLAGLSLKTLLLATIGFLLFGIYVGILVYGENSLTVLQRLHQKKEALTQEIRELKHSNQQLQKAYFGYIQVAPEGVEK